MDNNSKNESLKKIKFGNLKLSNRIQESGDVYTLKFEVPEGFSWTEGAHLHLGLKDFMSGGKPDKNKVRALSVMSLKEENYLGVSTRISDEGSEFKRSLLELEPGEDMVFFKLGNRMELKRSNRPIVLLSMGVGMATCRPIIKAYDNNSEGVEKLININVDRGKNHLFENEISELNNENLVNRYVYSRTEFYEFLNQSLVEKSAIYYVVGSDEFVKDVCGYLIEKKVEEEDIVIDKNDDKRELFINP